MYRALVMFCMCCIVVYNAGAQRNCNNNLNIQVVEAHIGQPLYAVVVHIDELNATYNTDEKGQFSMNDVCPGTYTFHLHAAGYKHNAERVTVSGSVSLKFRLAHIEGYMDELVVATSKDQSLLQSADGMDKKQLSANSGKTLADMLQAVNGVTIIANGATIAKPVIHGLHGNRIVMLNNGIRQEDQQWGGEHAPNIDPFIAGDVQVIKGAASVRCGIL